MPHDIDIDIKVAASLLEFTLHWANFYKEYQLVGFKGNELLACQQVNDALRDLVDEMERSRG